MELDAERSTFIGEAPDNFSCLRVPQIDKFVESCTQILATIVGEANISHRLCVALVGSDALAMRSHVPDLACAVMTGRKKQVSCLGEELNALDTLIVACPSVQPLFGDEAVVVLASKVARRLNETLSCLIEHATVAMVDGSWLE